MKKYIVYSKEGGEIVSVVSSLTKEIALIKTASLLKRKRSAFDAEDVSKYTQDELLRKYVHYYNKVVNPEFQGFIDIY